MMSNIDEAMRVLEIMSDQVDHVMILISNGNEPGADMRERLRIILNKLPDAARAVYNRSTISSPDTPLITVVENVVYHFDLNNRKRVAKQLDMDYHQMMALLVGWLLGRGQ